MKALLISNSGRPFLEHCMAQIRDFLDGTRRLAFVTAANLHDEAAYHQRARDALGAAPPAGCGVGTNESAENQAPRVGFEPTTNRLTAGCSTIELSGKSFGLGRW